MERAGNASLEEVALALYVRKDHYGLESQINLEETKKTSDLISRYAGIRVPRNKAIVGQNTFSHESEFTKTVSLNIVKPMKS